MKREIRNAEFDSARQQDRAAKVRSESGGPYSEKCNQEARFRVGRFQSKATTMVGNSNLWLRVWLSLAGLISIVSLSLATPADALFRDGIRAYRAGEYARAALEFRESLSRQPASGALQNLGNAEWQLGRVGEAILSWEQARWLDPFNEPARLDLRFARKTAQLEAPDLAWYEVISTWLPADWWTWIAGASLWLAVGMVLLPGILRRRKAAWHQAVAALGLMIFLLSIPAHLGGHTRSHLGFVLGKDTPLRLTPTLEAQVIARLAAGEPARCERVRGDYLLIRTRSEGFRGWVEREQFGLVCPNHVVSDR